MKKQDQTVENMIMQAHYLEALEIESKAQKPLAEMERQDFINTVTELKSMISSLKLTIDTLRQTINSQNATIASLQKSMDRLQSAYDKAVKERDDLNGRMNRSNQETFGSKSLKQSCRGKVVKDDRQKERDEWSSKDDNDNDASSVSSSADGEIDQTKVKSENLSRSGRNGMRYNRMNAAKTITLETSLEGAPEDMKFVGYKDIEEYTKKSYVECTVFKVAVYEDKFGVRHDFYQPKDEKDTRRPNLNVVPSTHCTPEFLADLVVDHYMLMTPIYRQSIRNVLDKLQISSNTNRNWLTQGAELLTPIVRLLKKKLLKAKSILNIDETWTKVRIKFNPNRSLEIFLCKKSDYSRLCHRYSICMLTQYADFALFQDKMKANFSNDRFRFNDILSLCIDIKMYLCTPKRGGECILSLLSGLFAASICIIYA